MSDTRSIAVFPSVDVLVAATAARLITELVSRQAGGTVPSVVLTGGGTGIGVLAAVAASPARAAVDWSHVEFWWGDERFVPADDDERNDRQARQAFLDQLEVDPELVHAMAPVDGPLGDDPDAAAAAYQQLLADRGVLERGFDVLMLGVGPEGHVASIFPDSPAAASQDWVTAVRDCPKPPPTRISLTFPAIGLADQVWLITAGGGKAEAVARAVGGAAPQDVPAAGAIGRSATWWFVDRDAAAQVDPDVVG
ncbi:6-phosphogluconolactonase [Nakamurella leprariae]|uniref:6-phosphogluconolactonase n=1 Tax=Nakamurella leprariae TaxID=2803911 RepID=A0A938YDK0_9ACTN|nr:6-phosphogluconolactonase [Nakamurella leprariae]MBM9466214.1 6-phosphogluconolactonase [Nakamurella leprariae]